MSADVDRVLKDYLQVIDKKDADHFRLVQRQQEMEALLIDCKERLLSLQGDVHRLTEERDELSAALQERSSDIQRLDDEVVNLRKFARSIRKCLVMDDPQRFSLAEVLHVLCARLEDYRTVAREHQLQTAAIQQQQVMWHQAFESVEQDFRQRMDALSAESSASIRSILQSASEGVALGARQRSDILLKASEEVEKGKHEAHAFVETLTGEVAGLRRHVEQLLEEGASLRRDGASASVLAETFARQLHDCQKSLDQQVIAADAAVEIRSSEMDALLVERGNILSALQHARRHEALAGQQIRTLTTVNTELRQQVATLSSSLKTRSSQLKERLSKEHSEELSRLESEKAAMKDKLAEQSNRDRVLSEKLRTLSSRHDDVVLQCEAKSAIAQQQQDTIHRLERSLQHRVKENHDLKELLQALQERSAQVRKLLSEGVDSRAKLDERNRQLDDEVALLHQRIQEVQRRAETQDEALHRTTSELAHLRDDAARSKQMHDSEVHRLNDHILTLTSELDQAQKQVLQSTNDHRAKVSALEQKQEEVEAELRRHVSEAGIASSRFTALKQQSDIESKLLNALVQDEREKIVSLTSLLTNAQLEVADLRRKLLAAEVPTVTSLASNTQRTVPQSRRRGSSVVSRGSSSSHGSSSGSESDDEGSSLDASRGSHRSAAHNKHAHARQPDDRHRYPAPAEHRRLQERLSQMEEAYAVSTRNAAQLREELEIARLLQTPRSRLE